MTDERSRFYLPEARRFRQKLNAALEIDATIEYRTEAAARAAVFAQRPSTAPPTLTAQHQLMKRSSLSTNSNGEQQQINNAPSHENDHQPSSSRLGNSSSAVDDTPLRRIVTDYAGQDRHSDDMSLRNVSAELRIVELEDELQAARKKLNDRRRTKQLQREHTAALRLKQESNVEDLRLTTRSVQADVEHEIQAATALRHKLAKEKKDAAASEAKRFQPRFKSAWGIDGSCDVTRCNSTSGVSSFINSNLPPLSSDEILSERPLQIRPHTAAANLRPRTTSTPARFFAIEMATSQHGPSSSASYPPDDSDDEEMWFKTDAERRQVRAQREFAKLEPHLQAQILEMRTAALRRAEAEEAKYRLKVEQEHAASCRTARLLLELNIAESTSRDRFLKEEESDRKILKDQLLWHEGEVVRKAWKSDIERDRERLLARDKASRATRDEALVVLKKQTEYTDGIRERNYRIKWERQMQTRADILKCRQRMATTRRKLREMKREDSNIQKKEELLSSRIVADVNLAQRMDYLDAELAALEDKERSLLRALERMEQQPKLVGKEFCSTGID